MFKCAELCVLMLWNPGRKTDLKQAMKSLCETDRRANASRFPNDDFLAFLIPNPMAWHLAPLHCGRNPMIQILGTPPLNLVSTTSLGN